MNLSQTLSVNALSTQGKGTVVALTGAVLMSLDPLFIKSSGVSGVDAAFLFGLFTAISMFSLLKARSSRGVCNDLLADGWPVLLAGVLMLISASSLIISLQFTSVINTFVILCAVPVVTSVFGRIFLGERTSTHTWIAILLVIAGVFTVVSGSVHSTNLTGDLLAFVSVIALSLKQTLLRYHKSVSRLATTGVGGFLLALSLIWFVEPKLYSASTWLIMAAMGLFSAPIGRVLSQVATRYITATEVGVILMLEAALAPLFAYLMFNEMPSSQSVLGGLIIFSAILYFLAKSTQSNQV